MPQVGAFVAGMVGAGTVVGSIGAYVAGLQVANFFTTTIIGRLLLTTAVTALRMALVDRPTSATPGIRSQQTLFGGVNPAAFVIGLAFATAGQLVAPPMSHGAAGGVPNAYLTYVIELGELPGQTLQGVIIDGEVAELGTTEHPDYGQPLLGRFTDHAWIKYYDGTQTAADPMLVDRYAEYERPWGLDRIGRGLCYAILTFKFNREIFSAFPRAEFVMGGIPLYDPRKDSTVGGVGAHRWGDKATWEPSGNCAVQIYNILRGIDLPNSDVWGGRAQPWGLPLSVWWAAMNECDVQTARADGGQEAQYRSAFEVFVNDEPAMVIEELLKACSGRIAELGGTYKMRAGGPGLPVWFVTDRDILIDTPQTFRPFPRVNEIHNGVHASFPDPAANWRSVDAPPRYNLTFEQEDGGQRRVADLRLPAVPYPDQVQRLSEAYLNTDRRHRRHRLALPPEAGVLEPLDTISYTSLRHGYMTGKAFEIAQTTNPLITGNPTLSLLEVDPNDHTFPPGGYLPSPLPTSPSVARPILSLLNFAAEGFTQSDAAGNPRRYQIRLSWANGANDFPGIRWQVRLKQSQAPVTFGQTMNVDDDEAFVSDGLIQNQVYQVRAEPISRNRTAWTGWVDVTTPNVGVSDRDLDTPLSARIAEADRIVAAHDALVAGFPGTIAGALATRDALIAGNATGLTALEGDVTALTATVSGVQSDLAMNYYTAAQVDGEISSAIASAETTLGSQIAAVQSNLAANYYTISEVNGQISTAVSAAQTTLQSNIDGLSANLSANYYTTAQVNNEIQQAVSAMELQLRAQPALDRTFSFLNGMGDFTGDFANPPATAGPPNPAWTDQATVEGRFARINGRLSTSYALLPREVFTPVPGRTYRLTCEVRKSSGLISTGPGLLGLFFRIQSGLYNYLRVEGFTSYHPTTSFETYSAEWTVPASYDGAFARAGMYVHSDRTAGSGTVDVRSIRIEDITDVNALDAAVTVTAVAAANAQATANTANATANSLQAQASASYVIRVAAGGGSAGVQLVSWDGASIIMLEADDIVARGTLSADRLRVGSGGNLIDDASFSARDNVEIFGSGGSFSQTSIAYREPGGSWAGRTYPTLRCHQDGTATDGFTNIYFKRVAGGHLESDISVEPGDWLIASAYISAHRCRSGLRIVWRRADLSWISGSPEELAAENFQSSSTNPDEWGRYHVKAQAPPGAAFAQLFVIKRPTQSGTSSTVFVHKPQVEKVHAEAELPTPWVNSGQTAISGDQIRTGSIRSNNYVSDSAGWSIDTAGNAEFNNLVLRGWLRDNSVSEGGETLSLASAHRDNDWIISASAGVTVDPGLVFVASVYFQHRNGGTDGTDITQSTVQYRVRSGSGTWLSWQFLAQWNSDATWRTRHFAELIVADGSDLQVRLIHNVPIRNGSSQHNARRNGVTLRSLPRR